MERDVAARLDLVPGGELAKGLLAAAVLERALAVLLALLLEEAFLLAVGRGLLGGALLLGGELAGLVAGLVPGRVARGALRPLLAPLALGGLVGLRLLHLLLGDDPRLEQLLAQTEQTHRANLASVALGAGGKSGQGGRGRQGGPRLTGARRDR